MLLCKCFTFHLGQFVKREFLFTLCSSESTDISIVSDTVNNAPEGVVSCHNVERRSGGVSEMIPGETVMWLCRLVIKGPVQMK